MRVKIHVVSNLLVSKERCTSEACDRTTHHVQQEVAATLCTPSRGKVADPILLGDLYSKSAVDCAVEQPLHHQSGTSLL